MFRRTGLFTAAAAIVITMGLGGCRNWKKDYESLNVEHQNLTGLYENCMASLDSSAVDSADCSNKLSQCRSELAALKSAKPMAKDTGFTGQVSVDEAAGTITVTLENAILFPSGSAKLIGGRSAELDQIFSVIRQRYSGKQVDVAGHTDSDPILKTKNQWQDNWDLSAGRALTVLRYLVGKGIEPNRIRGIAYGEARPVAPNTTSSGKAKNRRVEIVVHTR